MKCPSTLLQVNFRRRTSKNFAVHANPSNTMVMFKIGRNAFVDANLNGKRKAARVHMPPRKQRSFTMTGVLCNGQLYWPSLEVALETGSVLCRIALWDSFWKEF